MNAPTHAGFTAIARRIRNEGFAWVSAAHVRALLPAEALQDWAAFAESWNDLGVDAYMADNGRYRRRRFGAFAIADSGADTGADSGASTGAATRADAHPSASAWHGAASGAVIVRKPHQPHYQSRDYNPLNGGIERWFLPIKDEIGAHPTLQSILRLCFSMFHELTPAEMRPASWHVECHQFRIEARIGEHGHPTPEGLHRDGVDWVLVMLVARQNIAEGVTSIHDNARQLLGRFTLTEPFDSAFVDDSRVYHGVTPVIPIDPKQPAYRDVLVVTFRRE